MHKAEVSSNLKSEQFFYRPASGGRKSKSGFANPVFNTAFYQMVFGFGLYLRHHYFEYLDLDFIYELCQYLDLDLDLDLRVVDLCPPLRPAQR